METLQNRMHSFMTMSTLTAPLNIHELSEEEQQREIRDYYEQEVLYGLESGQPIPLTPEYWNEFLRKREERKVARNVAMFREE